MNTPKHFKRTELFLATCLIAGSFAPVAMAQSAAPAAEVSEILITGSRRSGMAVSDSPAPVQMINAEMLKESGSPDLMNAIATQVPSYNARQTGTDMASQTLTASMRALSANHALVLHQAAVDLQRGRQHRQRRGRPFLYSFFCHRAA